MSIHDIENVKRQQLFNLFLEKREQGVNFFDAQDLVKTSSFYRRVSDFKDMGYHFDVTEKKVLDPSTNKKRKYKHYHLVNDEPDLTFKMKREAMRKENKRFMKLRTEVKAFEKLSANGQAATCPVCKSQNHSDETKRGAINE